MENRAFLDRVQATPDKPKSCPDGEAPPREIKLSGKPIPQDILDDLCARFLLNIPESGMFIGCKRLIGLIIVVCLLNYNEKRII